MMAVHTHLTKAEITALIAPFDLGDVHGITPIADGTTNSIWRIDNETGRFVLTLYERTTDGLLDRLAFMDHLA
ncbi:MAG: homoserine kinase, partial [Pseudomonadota bacterium]|nr:homoserine kinase [Pseudomonadota bacterium]